MPLIDLKTNLKDLRFGHDEYKGASSNEPYVQTRIPATDEPLQTGFSVDASLNVDPNISILANNVGSGLGAIALGAGGGALIGSIVGPVGTIAGAAAGLLIGTLGAINTNGLELGIKADPKIQASLRINIPRAGTGGPDFLLRGGLLLPDRIGDDIARLYKFFTDTKGLLFTIKQNLLSRVSVRTQASDGLGILNDGTYTPLSTVLGAAGNAFGLHPNKQNLNPLRGLFNEQNYTPNRYFTELVKEINEVIVNPEDLPRRNRLAGLYSNVLVFNTGVSNFNSTGISLNDGNNILSYQGGPGSFLGVGRTNIRFATDNVGAPLKLSNNNLVKLAAISSTVASAQKEVIFGAYSTLNYKEISQIQPVSKNGIQQDFRKKLRPFPNNFLGSSSISYAPGDNKTLETRTQLGDPGNFNKNIDSYTNGNPNIKIYASYPDGKSYPQPGGGIGAASVNSVDDINASGPGNDISLPTDPPVYNDLVDFRIAIINNDTPSANRSTMYFRAFLDQISDQYISNWDATKFIGRGENFYTYSGFDRKISLSWTVAAQSKIELLQMYRKLNYLASVCAPDYSEEGYMRGNLIELTIGGYIYQQPGIMTGFTFEMNEENDTWEIAIDDNGDEDVTSKQLPHIIRVKSFNFIPIHKFVPKIQSIDFPDGQDHIVIYGDQRYIALENATGTNWNMSRYPVKQKPKI